MDGNFSAHFFYDGFGECQTYTVTFDAARVLGTEERLEDVGKVGLWNADAMIHNTNMRLVDDDLHGLAIKCEDLSWHLKKEFSDFPVHAIDYSAYMEEMIESIKQAERKAKQLAKGIAQPDFINALPVATLNEDSLLKESFHVVGKISTCTVENPIIQPCGS